MAPKLYIKAISPPCRAVITVAKALDIELELEEVEVIKCPEIMKINPQHIIPTLEDDDFVLWDSHAINGYLVNQYAADDSLYPKEPRQRALVDQRLHFDCSVLYPRFLAAYMPLLSGALTEISGEHFDKIEETFEFLEAFLEDRTWLCGDDVTIADYGILCSLSAIEIAIPIDSEKFPRLSDWLQRGKELPAFKEANEENLEQTKAFIKEKLGL